MITGIDRYKLGAGIGGLKLKQIAKDSLGPYADGIGDATWEVANLYEAESISFLDYDWQVALGVYQDKVYKIALQAVLDNEQDWNILFNKTMDYIKDSMGKHDKHPLFSKRYIWERQEGHVVLQKDRVLNALGINLYIQNSVFNVNS